MRGPEVRPIVIAAGGTGGHFYPAEALAAALSRRGQWVVLMTDARSGALNSEVFDPRDRYVVAGAGIAGRGVLRAGRAAAALAAGVLQARSILTKLRPAAVVAFGGYPSVAPVLAARLMRAGPPIILHEQNAVLGRANRFLARQAARFGRQRVTLALSFVSTGLVPAGTPVEVTGNPVRPAVAALFDAGYEAPGSGPVRLVILGGSLGARVFSDVVPDALCAMPGAARSRPRITQQVRREDMDRVRARYEAAGLSAELAPFFGDVAGLLRDAHVVIARAGASTVAELAVAGRPSILVPLPGAIDDHQTANARSLVEAGGGWLMKQETFSASALTELLTRVLDDPAALVRAAEGARAVARPAAALALADLVERVAAVEVPA